MDPAQGMARGGRGAEGDAKNKKYSYMQDASEKTAETGGS